MAKEREPLFIVAAGEKNSGKTYYTLHEIIQKYVKGSEGIPPRKVIVVDINNEYPFRTLPVVVDAEKNINTIIGFNKQTIVEARKVSIFKKDGDRKSATEIKTDLGLILKHFKNGLIVIEDINKIMPDNMAADIFGYLCTNRHLDVDILINVQNIGRAGNPKIKSTMNVLRLHHVQESVWRHEEKFEEHIESLRIAQLIVNNRYDVGLKKIRELEAKGKSRGDKNYDFWDIQYIKFYVFIDFYKNSIYGNFTSEEFENAVYDYIYENEKYTIQPLLKRRDRSSGKVLFNYKTAGEKLVYDISLKYYGNR